MAAETSFADLAWRLAQRVDELVPELLPNARREHQLWRVGSVAGEAGQSLAIERGGAKRGLWFDHSADEGGDLLTLIAKVRTGGRLGPAAGWARQWLGEPADPQRIQPRPQPRPEGPPAPNRDALNIWYAALPLSAGDPVWRYLLGRGIDLGRLGRQPGALRYHPRLWHRPSETFWPAMVALIAGPDGKAVAVHRTYLQILEAYEEVEGFITGVRKAPLGHDAKLTLGRYKGGCIRLSRGRSGQPWSKMRPGETLLLGEGIEDVLAAMLRYREWRAAAGVSLSAMSSIALPAEISTIALLRQRDPAGSPAAVLVDKIMRRFVGEGRRVLEWQIPVFVKDIAELAEKTSNWERRLNDDAREPAAIAGE